MVNRDVAFVGNYLIGIDCDFIKKGIKTKLEKMGNFWYCFFSIYVLEYTN